MNESVYNWALENEVARNYAEVLKAADVRRSSMLRDDIIEDLVSLRGPDGGQAISVIAAKDIVAEYRSTVHHGGIAIYWDIESVPPPPSSSVLETVKELRVLLSKKYGCIKEFKAYLDPRLNQGHAQANRPFAISDADLVALNDCGVDIVYAPHMNRKEVADKMIIVDTMWFVRNVDAAAAAASALKNSNGGRGASDEQQQVKPSICIISRDSDFSPLISKISMNGFHTVSITMSSTTAQVRSLNRLAAEHYQWDDFPTIAKPLQQITAAPPMPDEGLPTYQRNQRSQQGQSQQPAAGEPPLLQQKKNDNEPDGCGTAAAAAAAAATAETPKPSISALEGGAMGHTATQPTPAVPTRPNAPSNSAGATCTPTAEPLTMMPSSGPSRPTSDVPGVSRASNTNNKNEDNNNNDNSANWVLRPAESTPPPIDDNDEEDDAIARQSVEYAAAVDTPRDAHHTLRQCILDCLNDKPNEDGVVRRSFLGTRFVQRNFDNSLTFKDAIEAALRDDVIEIGGDKGTAWARLREKESLYLIAAGPNQILMGKSAIPKTAVLDVRHFKLYEQNKHHFSRLLIGPFAGEAQLRAFVDEHIPNDDRIALYKTNKPNVDAYNLDGRVVTLKDFTGFTPTIGLQSMFCFPGRAFRVCCFKVDKCPDGEACRFIHRVVAPQ